MSEPAERTLKEMLREVADHAYSHGGPGWDIPEAVVRRAARIALLFAEENATRHVHYSCAAGVAKAILADAGLDEEERDE